MTEVTTTVAISINHTTDFAKLRSRFPITFWSPVFGNAVKNIIPSVETTLVKSMAFAASWVSLSQFATWARPSIISATIPSHFPVVGSRNPNEELSRFMVGVALNDRLIYVVNDLPKVVRDSKYVHNKGRDSSMVKASPNLTRSKLVGNTACYEGPLMNFIEPSLF